MRGRLDWCWRKRIKSRRGNSDVTGNNKVKVKVKVKPPHVLKYVTRVAVELHNTNKKQTSIRRVATDHGISVDMPMFLEQIVPFYSVSSDHEGYWRACLRLHFRLGVVMLYL